MSSIPISHTPLPASDERRAYPRRRLDQLAYIGFGPDSGGVLLDVSEGGLRCQIVGAVIEGDLCRLKFSLPGSHSAIETQGQVVWSNRTRQGGGIRLIEIDEQARLELQQWILAAAASPSHKPSPPIPIRAKAVSSLPAAPPAAAADVPDGIPPGSPHRGPDIPSCETPAPATPLTILGAPVLSAPAAEPVAAPAAFAAIAPPEPKDRRVLMIAGIVGFVVLAAVGLAFSQKSTSQLATLLGGEANRSVSAQSEASADAYPATEVAPQRQFEPEPAIDAPDALSSAAHLPSRAAANPVRSEPAVSNSAPAKPNRPAQPPQATDALGRPQLAMALPKPRAGQSAIPAAEPTGDLSSPAAAPPAPLLDFQSLGTQPPGVPQPDRPAAAAGYKPPQLLSRVEPTYSGLAQQSRLQGSVKVNATVGLDGVPHSVVCVSGNAALCQMAIAAVSQWRYQPATSDGQPTEAPVATNFTFQLR